MTDSNDIEDLECPVCFEEPGENSIIYQCSRGHLICKGCFDKLQESEQICPTCRSCFICFDGEPQRNRVAENLHKILEQREKRLANKHKKEAVMLKGDIEILTKENRNLKIWYEYETSILRTEVRNLTAKENLDSKHKQDLNDLRTKVRILTTENKILFKGKEDAKRYKLEVKSLALSNRNLKNKISEETCYLKSTIHNLSEENASLKAETDHLQTVIDAASNLKLTIHNLSEENASLKAETAHLQKAVEAAKASSEEDKHNTKKLEEEMQRLTEENKKIKDQRESVLRQLSASTGENKSLKYGKMKLTSEYDKLRSENERLKRALCEANVRNRRLQTGTGNRTGNGTGNRTGNGTNWDEHYAQLEGSFGINNVGRWGAPNPNNGYQLPPAQFPMMNQPPPLFPTHFQQPPPDYRFWQ